MISTRFTPPAIDQATIDYYVARGRRERSRAFSAMIKSLFSSPEGDRKAAARRVGRKPSHA